MRTLTAVVFSSDDELVCLGKFSKRFRGICRRIKCGDGYKVGIKITFHSSRSNYLSALHANMHISNGQLLFPFPEVCHKWKYM